MTKYKFSNRSISNISGIDARLAIILGAMLYASPYDFIITEGLRTAERQKELYDSGKSKTLNSKHLNGKAFDVAIIDDSGNVTWNSRYYKEFADVLLKLANRLGFDVMWGGNFKDFYDGPHFQIND